MSVAILAPTGAGSLTEWGLIGASTNWEAVESPSLGNVFASVNGQRDRYTFEDLPADATGVTSVAVYGMCGQEAPGGGTMRFTLDLSGVESNGAAFEPPEGAYDVASTSFAQAPGSLAWTVARVNALTAGLDVVASSGAALAVDAVWLYVEYTSSAPTPPGETATVDLGSDPAIVDETSETDLALYPTTATVDLGENPVDIALSADTSPSVDFGDEGAF